MGVEISKNLPVEVDPFALAKKGATYHSMIALSDFSRLKALLAEDKGQIEVALRFMQESHLPATMQGKISGTLVLTCQRCGSPMDYTMTACPELRIVVTDEQAKNLSRGEEALVTQGGEVNLMELVEDEILLNLPMIPRHKEEECLVQPPYDFS